MTDYAKIQVSIVYSPNSDYSSPIYHRLFESTYTPSEVQIQRVSVATGGTTVELGSFTTPTTVIVKNTDATNYVTAAFTNAASSSQSQVIALGETAVFPDVKASGDLVLTANTAAVVCDVVILGD